VNLLIKDMGFAFLVLFSALILGLFRLHQIALVITACALVVVSISAFALYMTLPLGG
jgi:hypothetical protein